MVCRIHCPAGQGHPLNCSCALPLYCMGCLSLLSAIAHGGLLGICGAASSIAAESGLSGETGIGMPRASTATFLVLSPLMLLSAAALYCCAMVNVRGEAAGVAVRQFRKYR